MNNNYIYKEIPNYSRYLICDDGEVYLKGSMRKMQTVNSSGSRVLHLRRDDLKREAIILGKLILETFGFVYPYSDRAWIRYRDNNRLNTALCNIYWEGNYTATVPEEERHLFKPYPVEPKLLCSADGRICNEKYWVYRVIPYKDTYVVKLPSEIKPKPKEKIQPAHHQAKVVIATTWGEWPTNGVYCLVNHKDGNPFNFAVENLEIVSKIVPASELHLFKPVPSYPDLSVTRCGRVINNKAVTEYSTSSIADDYIKINYKVKGKRKPIKIHRLVAMTYLPLPDNYKNLEVNHINGIRYDNRVENLEWVTGSGNMQHAYTTGLNKSSTECLLVHNAEIARFKSLSDLGRCLMVSSQRLDTIIKKPTQDLQIITFTDKDTPVTSHSGLTIIPSSLPIKLYNQTIIVYDIITGELHLHDNANKAAKTLSISVTSVINRANRDTDFPLYNYVFRWADNVKKRPIRFFTEQEITAFKDKAVVSPVIAVLPSGEEKLYASTKEATKPINDAYFKRYV